MIVYYNVKLAKNEWCGRVTASMSKDGNQKEADVYEQNSKEDRKRRKRLIASHHINGSIILLLVVM